MKDAVMADNVMDRTELSSYSAIGFFFVFKSSALAVSSAHLSITPFEADVIRASFLIAKQQVMVVPVFKSSALMASLLLFQSTRVCFLGAILDFESTRSQRESGGFVRAFVGQVLDNVKAPSVARSQLVLKTPDLLSMTGSFPTVNPIVFSALQ